MIGGVRITLSADVLKRVRVWPEKKRSRRLIKKMTEKRGPEFIDKPAIYQTPIGFVCHPSLYQSLKEAINGSA